jgi:hypothetical protein
MSTDIKLHGRKSSAALVGKMLELSVMTKSREIGLAHCCIIVSRMPYPFDHLRQSHVVSLELVEAPHDQQCCDIECPVECLAQTGMFPDREVVCDT